MGRDHNSTNTIVLELHAQGDNLRMLLVHRLDDVPDDMEWRYKREYIIGSYFCEDVTSDGVSYYSWDWGHYFNDLKAAYYYWKRVKGGEA